MREASMVVATTDFHSAFDGGLWLLDRLAAQRARGGLLVDSGDFFEGSGYYRLGSGRLETQVLTRLYDVVAPGNHGFAHYRAPALAATAACCNLTGPDGTRPFATHQRYRVAGRRVLVTGIVGERAFGAIPPDERRAVAMQPPDAALARLWAVHGHDVDALLLLSHAGWTHDQALAPALATLGVPVLVLAGHCHSPVTGPTAHGSVLLAKAPEYGTGWVDATLTGGGTWAATVHRTPTCRTEPPAAATPCLAAAVPDLPAQLAEVRRRLDRRLGAVAPGWRGVLDRELLAGQLAERLLATTGADAAVVNVYALRGKALGSVLTLADLLEVEPFDNQVGLFDTDGAALAACLVHPATEPVQFAGYLGPGRLRLATTRYLAATSLASIPATAVSTTHRLRDVVCAVLLAPPPSGDGDAR